MSNALPHRQRLRTEGAALWVGMLRRLAGTYDLGLVNECRSLFHALECVTQPVDVDFLDVIACRLCGWEPPPSKRPRQRGPVLRVIHRALLEDAGQGDASAADSRARLLSAGVGVATGLQRAGAPAETVAIVRRLLHQIEEDAEIVDAVSGRLPRRS